MFVYIMYKTFDKGEADGIQNRSFIIGKIWNREYSLKYVACPHCSPKLN